MNSYYVISTFDKDDKPVYFVSVGRKEFKESEDGEKLTTYEPKVELTTSSKLEDAKKFDKLETASAFLGRNNLQPLGFKVGRVTE